MRCSRLGGIQVRPARVSWEVRSYLKRNYGPGHHFSLAHPPIKRKRFSAPTKGNQHEATSPHTTTKNHTQDLRLFRCELSKVARLPLILLYFGYKTTPVTHYNLQSKITLLSQKETGTCPSSNKITNTSLNFQIYSNRLPNTRSTTRSPRLTEIFQNTNCGKNSPKDQSHEPRKSIAPPKTGTLSIGSTVRSTI